MVVASSDGLFLGARALIKCDSVTSILQMASSEHFVNLPLVKISLSLKQSVVLRVILMVKQLKSDCFCFGRPFCRRIAFRDLLA